MSDPKDVTSLRHVTLAWPLPQPDDRLNMGMHLVDVERAFQAWADRCRADGAPDESVVVFDQDGFMQRPSLRAIWDDDDSTRRLKPEPAPEPGPPAPGDSIIVDILTRGTSIMQWLEWCGYHAECVLDRGRATLRFSRADEDVCLAKHGDALIWDGQRVAVATRPEYDAAPDLTRGG